MSVIVNDIIAILFIRCSNKKLHVTRTVLLFFTLTRFLSMAMHGLREDVT